MQRLKKIVLFLSKYIDYKRNKTSFYMFLAQSTHKLSSASCSGQHYVLANNNVFVVLRYCFCTFSYYSQLCKLVMGKLNFYLTIICFFNYLLHLIGKNFNAKKYYLSKYYIFIEKFFLTTTSMANMVSGRSRDDHCRDAVGNISLGEAR
jgi:hypothetical protein